MNPFRRLSTLQLRRCNAQSNVRWSKSVEITKVICQSSFLFQGSRHRLRNILKLYNFDQLLCMSLTDRVVACHQRVRYMANHTAIHSDCEVGKFVLI